MSDCDCDCDCDCSWLKLMIQLKNEWFGCFCYWFSKLKENEIKKKG